MRVYRMHWSLHPHRDLEWYRKQCERLRQDEVAKDLDISYLGAVSSKVFPQFDHRKHVISRFPQIPSKATIYRIWDFGGVNCVLYVYITPNGHKRILHERILQPSDSNGNSLITQAETAMRDSAQLFPQCEFFDICDPAGSYKGYNTYASDVEILNNQYGVYPSYQRINSLPKQTRKKDSITYVQSDLELSPSGKESIQIYCAGELGCPTVVRAFAGGYSYKKDSRGNTDYSRINEKHPYEDVMDCIFYLYQELALDSTSNGISETITATEYQPIYRGKYF